MSQITIRRSLLTNLSLLVLLTAGAIFAVTVYGGLGAVDDLSRDQISSTTDRVDSQLDMFFGVVSSQTGMIREWSEAGLLEIDAVDRLNRTFVPLLSQYEFLSSLMIANSRGEEYMILRDPVDPTRWSNRVVRVSGAELNVVIREWDTSTNTVTASEADIDYDPRKRLWYEEALKSTAESPIYWTRPAVFFVTRDPGVTAATHWVSNEADSLTTVIAVDLLLMDISRFIGELEVSQNGRAFVLFEEPTDSTLKVLAFPGDEKSYTDEDIRGILAVESPGEASTDSAPELPNTQGFILPLIDAAAASWLNAGQTADPIDFQHENKTWWAGLHPYVLGGNRLWIGVAVPEEDFIGDVHRRAIIIVVAAFLALIVAAMMSILMARSYSEPLERLALGSRRLGNLDLSEGDTISSNLREVEQLALEQERMRVTLDSFSRYVPVELVRELLESGEAAKIGGTRRTITALFTDIVGFTTISEALGPEKLTVHMAEYFELVLETIQRNSGDVNQLLGDGVLAYWGAPKIDPDHARHAVEAVLRCQERLKELNLEWQERGLPSLPTRYGLAAGDVMVGNVGSKSRLAYAAVGDNVNLASRLEGLTRFYDATILTSGSVREYAGPGYEWLHVDSVRVKGKTEAVELFEPLGRQGEVGSQQLAFRDQYEAARQHYLQREFREAINMLRELPEEKRSLLMVERLITASSEFLSEPPEDSWDGVTNFKVK